MKAHALVDDHLAVEVIERADAEVAVLQQLGDGDGSVVNAVEERRHRRRLVQGVRLRRIVVDPVLTFPMGQHRRRPAAEPLVRGLRGGQRVPLPASRPGSISGSERTGLPGPNGATLRVPCDMTDVEVFIDPSCPWAWVTSRWLVEVAPQRDLAVTWRSYCLEIRDDYGVAPTVPEEYRQQALDGHAVSHRMLRIFEAARAEGGEGGRRPALHGMGRSELRQERPSPRHC